MSETFCTRCEDTGAIPTVYGPPHNPVPNGELVPCPECADCYRCGESVQMPTVNHVVHWTGVLQSICDSCADTGDCDVG